MKQVLVDGRLQVSLRFRFGRCCEEQEKNPCAARYISGQEADNISKVNTGNRQYMHQYLELRRRISKLAWGGGGGYGVSESRGGAGKDRDTLGSVDTECLMERVTSEWTLNEGRELVTGERRGAERSSASRSWAQMPGMLGNRVPGKPRTGGRLAGDEVGTSYRMVRVLRLLPGGAVS